MRLISTALVLLLATTFVWCAPPESRPEPSTPKYRVETAEVHINFTATDQHNLPVSDLATTDVILLQDGQPRQIVALEHKEYSAISAAVLTDSSESMGKSVAVARESWQWMNRNMIRSEDHLLFLDFDDALLRPPGQKPGGVYLTCLYDSLIRVIPQVARRQSRRALILFTDGVDNASYHALDDVIEAALAEGVAIYAITTPKFKVRYNYDVLDKLTESTGGKFFSIENADQMIFAVKLIEQDLRSSYELVFRPDKTKPGLRRLILKSPRQVRLNYQTAYYQPEIRSTGLVEVAAAGR
jgi:hypothetical protein